ncbi:PUA domain-containing protein [Caldivirga maquilingensis]|uniref:PUA domain containing protein n=1 Tax=Caldivirga maquilingensis (strain ATCC 700844 / DSM 13496 / JCM 10307 / IC-167) TaxID=397948 RepID=A8MDM3_CALMQ|nr:PUA domain-containing protein [Caldivirga maquilingensis]ABW01879.1 PUA domain containing protein [Caldivirga maquilingensis IC-167]
MVINRHMLSKKDIKRLMNEVPWLSEVYGNIEEAEVIKANDNLEIYRIMNDTALVKAVVSVSNTSMNLTYPTLLAANKYPSLVKYYPVVQVDEGAVKPIATGADVMRPGIRELTGSFKPGEIVLVKSPGGRVIAVTVSLYSSDEVINMSRGKVLKNIHHVDDYVWRLMSEVHEHK